MVLILSSTLLVTLAAQSRPCLGSFSEGFESGLPTGWQVYEPCDTVAVTGGELVIQKGDGCAGNAGIVMTPANGLVCGDFDVQVRFDLPVFPVSPPGSWRWAALRVDDASNGNHLATIERFTESPGNPCIVAAHMFKAFTTSSLGCDSTVIATTGDDGPVSYLAR